MKIGTWNLDAKWGKQHEELIRHSDCDVWLLTEVSSELQMTNYYNHRSSMRMARGQHYASVLSRKPITPLCDPHGASAAAVIDGIIFCSSILPWSACASEPSSPWFGQNSVGEMVQETIERLASNLPLSKVVWGGDLNQNLTGGWQYVGSKAGREIIEHFLDEMNLQITTGDLPHQRDGSYTIDHIAIPKTWQCFHARRIDASKLSDHDAYVIEAKRPSALR